MIKIKKGQFWDGKKQLPQVEALQSLRKHRGWDAAFIAKETGFSKRTVEGWFAGRSKVNPGAMMVLSKLRR